MLLVFRKRNHKETRFYFADVLETGSAPPFVRSACRATEVPADTKVSTTLLGGLFRFVLADESALSGHLFVGAQHIVTNAPPEAYQATPADGRLPRPYMPVPASI